MASTYTAGIYADKPANGDYSGNWGGIQNANLDRADDALAGVLAYTVNTDATLTEADSLHAVMKLGGTPAAARTLTIDTDIKKLLFAANTTDKQVTFRGSGGTTTTLVMQPYRQRIGYTDDISNVHPVDEAKRLKAPHWPVKSTSGSGAITLNLTEGSVHELTLTGNATLTIGRVPLTGHAAFLTLRVIQGGSGSYTITWPTTTLWPGGTSQQPATAVGAVSRFVLFTVDGGTNWFAFLAGKGFA